MNRRENKSLPMNVLIILVSLAAVLCIVLGTLMYLDNRALIRNEEDDNKVTQTQAQTAAKEENDYYDSLLPADKTVDIAGLQDTINKDIYAWLYIPDTGIDEAIYQHPDDAVYYSTHDGSGAVNEDGVLFTQMFNSKDFSDNVTVVYGHNGGDDKGFSRLNLYADPEFFKSHPYIYIYTDSAILLYETFAAYESDDKLIVLFYGTSDHDMYNVYLQRLEEIAGISSNLNKEHWPTADDKILTLSTGVRGRDDRRFLVQARFVGGFIEDKGNE